jgi:hypothetical protein
MYTSLKNQVCRVASTVVGSIRSLPRLNRSIASCKGQLPRSHSLVSVALYMSRTWNRRLGVPSLLIDQRVHEQFSTIRCASLPAKPLF